MLKLVGEQEADRIVAFLEDKGAIAARICAYLRCYRTLMNDIYFWSQDNNGEISAVISRVDGNMTVYADGRADFDEISEFVRIIGFSTLLMSYEYFGEIGIKPHSSGDILCFRDDVKPVSRDNISDNADLKAAYELLRINKSESIEVTEYLPWLSDFTYKRNRNSARMKSLFRDCMQVCFAMTSAETDKSALISGVVTDREYRKQGYASSVVYALCDELKREGKTVYIMTASEENKNFYLKNGFACIGKWGSVIG